MVDAANAQSGNPWTRAANSNPVLEFIDNVLRGSGQVIFMKPLDWLAELYCHVRGRLQ